MPLLKTASKYIAATSLLIVLMSGTASANQDHALKLDQNGDQQLSKSEFLDGATARFDAADTNRDNFISDDERKAQREANRESREDRRFAKTDLDNDGQISKEEFDTVRNTRREKAQSRRDVNNDGLVDATDRELRKEQRKTRRADRKTRRAERKASQSERGETKIKGPDTNEDGFVSREEHMVAAERMFEFLDQNNDGVLSQGEGAKRKARRGKKKNHR